MKSNELVEWGLACDKEISMLREMRVWDKVDLPSGRKAVSCKWVFRWKTNLDGTMLKNKAQFAVQGFNQEQGVDFNESFAPTARFLSLIILFAIKIKRGWVLKGFDVVSAYPHSHVEEELYVMPPDGYPC